MAESDFAPYLDGEPFSSGTVITIINGHRTVLGGTVQKSITAKLVKQDLTAPVAATAPVFNLGAVAGATLGTVLGLFASTQLGYGMDALDMIVFEWVMAGVGAIVGSIGERLTRRFD